MLQEEIGPLMRGRSIAVAESCTGGLISNMMTDVPGSSAYFLAGLVTYDNRSKVDLLGVRESSLIEHGAVSEQVAREMAVGVREATGADIGLSTTGIAGPGGATNEKPVGLVHIGLSSQGGTMVEEHVFPGSRIEIKRAAAEHALRMVIDLLRWID